MSDQVSRYVLPFPETTEIADKHKLELRTSTGEDSVEKVELYLDGLKLKSVGGYTLDKGPLSQEFDMLLVALYVEPVDVSERLYHWSSTSSVS